MKKGINLIIKQKKYLAYEKFFQNFRVMLVIITGLFLLIFVGLFSIVIGKNRELDQLLLEKKRLLEFISQNQKVEAEFTYFRNKQQRLQQILNEDVNFLPYYHLITDSLKSASPEPKLEIILITKDRSINFTLTFDNPNSTVLFLKFAESDTFLKNFSQLLISQFNLERSKDKEASSYKLNLIGQLNPINENKN